MTGAASAAIRGHDPARDRRTRAVISGCLTRRLTYSAPVFADDEASTSRRALGQVVEWLVWAAIVGHSERTTHVFLPLDDRGVDGIVRRVEDEAMCAVQVKGRTSLRHRGLRSWFGARRWRTATSPSLSPRSTR